MTFTLPPAHERLQAEARALATRLASLADAADAADRFDPQMRAALADSGLCRLAVPEAYGGRFPRVDPLAVTVVREALMAESAHLDSMFGMQGVGSFAISVGGSEALKQAWLPRVATLDAVAALALTEPEIGSDLRSVSTRARVDGESLVVEGRKAFITNAGDAAFYCVLAREDDAYSLVLVPAGAHGVSVASGPDLIAPHVMGEVTFDGVRVPVDNRLGAPGDGFSLALATLATFRVSVAGAAVGLAQAALEEAVRHTRTREQFGRPLIALGAVGQLLATSWVEIEAARALVYRAASAAAEDPRAALHLSSMAKVAATETAGRVVDRAVQVMGRFGLVRGSKIERLYRNARPLRIYEGATEVILDSLARRLQKEID